MSSRFTPLIILLLLLLPSAALGEDNAFQYRVIERDIPTDFIEVEAELGEASADGFGIKAFLLSESNGRLHLRWILDEISIDLGGLNYLVAVGIDSGTLSALGEEGWMLETVDLVGQFWTFSNTGASSTPVANAVRDSAAAYNAGEERRLNEDSLRADLTAAAGAVGLVARRAVEFENSGGTLPPSPEPIPAEDIPGLIPEGGAPMTSWGGTVMYVRTGDGPWRLFIERDGEEFVEYDSATGELRRANAD